MASRKSPLFDSESPLDFAQQQVMERMEGLQVPLSGVLRIWPETKESSGKGERSAPLSKAARKPRNKGGRPTIHDWAGAASFAGDYVAENDYPSEQATLVDVIIGWFKGKSGKSPDWRHVERFVSDMYVARSKRQRQQKRQN